MASPSQNTFGFLVLKICLLVAFLLALPFIVSNWHPLLLPIFTHTMPQLWTTLQAWLNAPVLFVLMNLVVGAVYFTSGRVYRVSRRAHADEDEMDPREAEDRVDEKSFAGGPEARPGKFSVRERLPRLVRSKSDQILPPKPVESPASGLKKFSSGSEATHRIKGPPPKDVPEEDPVSEEVDKKAEDFIGSFYQRLKLQRLDSLTQYQGWINRNHGPPTA